MIIDFNSAVQEKYKRINEINEMFLATCADEIVTSRLVSVSCFENAVYFLSWNHHMKCKQIDKNPNICFSFKNLQMIGTACIRGNPKNENNREISLKFKSKQPDIYTYFSSLDGMVIVESKISCIKSWEKTNEGYFIDHIDIKNQTAYRIKPQEELKF